MKEFNIFYVTVGESYNNCLPSIIRQDFGDEISELDFLHEESKLRQADPGLSERGVEQARQLEKWLADGGSAQIIKYKTFTILDHKYDIFTRLLCLILGESRSK